MKKIIFLLIVSLFIFSCGKKSEDKSTSDVKGTILPKVDKTKPDRDKTDLEKENIAGKVKKVSEESFEARKSSSGNIEKGKSKEVKKTEYDEKGFEKHPSYAKIKKDSNGRIIEEEGYYGGSPASMMTYKYDSQGNMIQDTYYGYESGDGFMNTYRHNDKGWVSEVIPDGEGPFSPSQYEYDKEGNKVAEMSEGLGSGNNKYKYDDRGNVIEWIYGATIRNDQGNILTYKYEFDEKGNWIKKIEYNDKKEPISLIERTLEYYVDNTAIYSNAAKAFEDKNYVLVFESLRNISVEDEKYFEFMELLFKSREGLMGCSCKQNFATISGKILDKSGKPIAGYITLENLSTKQVITKCKINPNDGRYFIILPLGVNCGFYVEKQGYYPVSKTFDLTAYNTESSEAVALNKTEDITLISIEEMAKENVAVAINNIFFDFDKAILKSESFPELDRLADLLKSNSGMLVEISGHTDNVGNASYNLTLSEQRAQSVIDYLVSKGCNKNNLIAKGYGDTKPITSNDSEDGRAKNRRVEFRILKNESRVSKSNNVAGSYSVGPTSCSIDASNKIRWAKGTGYNLLKLIGEYNGIISYEERDINGAYTGKFEFNSGYSSGTFVRKDGRFFDVRKTK